MNFSPTRRLQSEASGATNESEVSVELDGSGSGASVPASYSIPADKLQEMTAARMSGNASYWSHSYYRGTEDQRVIVHYCTKLADVEKVAPLFSGKSVLGFDLEWKPQTRRSPTSENHLSPEAKLKQAKDRASLIQLASEDRIALFHIALQQADSVEGLVPPVLRKILEDPTITKVGVAIQGDATRVKKYLGVRCRGILELSRLYHLVTGTSESERNSKKPVRLATQVDEHLGFPLAKPYDVRAGDWSRRLNLEQTNYAATDVYACIQLFNKLESKRKQLDPVPPRPAFSDAEDIWKDDTAAAAPATEEDSVTFGLLADMDASGLTSQPSQPVDTDESDGVPGQDRSDQFSLRDEGSSSQQGPSPKAGDFQDPFAAAWGIPKENWSKTKWHSRFAPGEELQESEDHLHETETSDPPPSEPEQEQNMAQTTRRHPFWMPLTIPRSSFVGHVNVAEASTATNASPNLWRGSSKQESTVNDPAERGRANEQATTWVQEWQAQRAESQQPRAKLASLRAYAIWHCQGREVAETAALLRDPPLRRTTVASYILEAVHLEKLPYDSKRIADVLGRLPKAVTKVVYPSIWRNLEEVHSSSI